MYFCFQQIFFGIFIKVGEYECLIYDLVFEWSGGGWVFIVIDLVCWGDVWFFGEVLFDEYLDFMCSLLNYYSVVDNDWFYGIGLQWQ